MQLHSQFTLTVMRSDEAVPKCTNRSGIVSRRQIIRYGINRSPTGMLVPYQESEWACVKPIGRQPDYEQNCGYYGSSTPRQGENL